MRIAIVHDYIKEYGGAERVLLELHKLFPDAPIYTSLYKPEYLGPHKKDFADIKIEESFFKYIPFAEKLISPLRILAPFAFKSFDLSGFDLIIVSQTGAYFPNLVSKGKKTKLLCYTHTPPRYLYGYMTAREVKSSFIKFLSLIVFHFLRMVDFHSSQNVDYFIANSEEVRARIVKFYRRDAAVINPPVDVASLKLKTKNKKGNYYLAGGRLARAKGMDIILEAFNGNGKKLKIFGKGFAGFGEELRSLAHKNIEFLGEVTEDEKFELMKEAKAYVFSSFDEDFGITPVEAMASGTPVIAFKSGGVKETVVDGKTGVFYGENTPDALEEAIKKFEKMKIDSESCQRQADKFSSQVFDKKIVEYVKKVGR